VPRRHGGARRGGADGGQPVARAGVKGVALRDGAQERPECEIPLMALFVPIRPLTSSELLLRFVRTPKIPP
jgi:hypothetical protein